MALSFNVIGAGRLGKTIALNLANSGKAELKAVCNRNLANAQSAVQQIGCGIALSSLDDLPLVNLSFITCPDDSIPLLAEQLANKKCIAPQSTVVHCSGLLNADALIPLKELGCSIASFHPLKAFRNKKPDPKAFEHCLCTLEGDAEATKIISSLFSKLGAEVLPIKSEKKIAYHAAAVMASNYLVTLAAAAIELFHEAEIPSPYAKQITTQLMTSSLNQIQQTEKLCEALTGPLERGDFNTLSQHLSVLTNKKTKDLYKAAALATISLTPHSEELKSKLFRLLMYS